MIWTASGVRFPGTGSLNINGNVLNNNINNFPLTSTNSTVTVNGKIVTKSAAQGSIVATDGWETSTESPRPCSIDINALAATQCTTNAPASTSDGTTTTYYPGLHQNLIIHERKVVFAPGLYCIDGQFNTDTGSNGDDIRGNNVTFLLLNPKWQSPIIRLSGSNNVVSLQAPNDSTDPLHGILFIHQSDPNHSPRPLLEASGNHNTLRFDGMHYVGGNRELQYTINAKGNSHQFDIPGMIAEGTISIKLSDPPNKSTFQVNTPSMGSICSDDSLGSNSGGSNNGGSSNPGHKSFRLLG